MKQITELKQIIKDGRSTHIYHLYWVRRKVCSFSLLKLKHEVKVVFLHILLDFLFVVRMCDVNEGVCPIIQNLEVRLQGTSCK